MSGRHGGGLGGEGLDEHRVAVAEGPPHVAKVERVLPHVHVGQERVLHAQEPGCPRRPTHPAPRVAPLGKVGASVADADAHRVRVKSAAVELEEPQEERAEVVVLFSGPTQRRRGLLRAHQVSSPLRSRPPRSLGRRRRRGRRRVALAVLEEGQGHELEQKAPDAAAGVGLVQAALKQEVLEDEEQRPERGEQRQLVAHEPARLAKEEEEEEEQQQQQEGNADCNV